jgi:hypothetical protein
VKRNRWPSTATSWSADDKRLLIYTNFEKGVAAQYQRRLLGARCGDRQAAKIGGDAKPFDVDVRKFSPDGPRVGYVRESDLYVETCRYTERSRG